MRVSDNSTFDAMRRQLSSAQSNVMTAQNQASSGLKVSKPSDDPVAAAAARRETSRKSLADAAKAATDKATTSLQGTDDALNDAYNQLSSVRDLALQASSSTMSAADRSAAAVQVRSIKDELVALGNTNVAGSYVFGGYADGKQPYATDGTFVGDSNTKAIQSAPGLRVPASIAGPAVFGSGSDGVFAKLDQLASALDNNDPDAIKASYDALSTNSDQVLNARAAVGSMMDNVTVAASIADRVSTTAQDQVTALTGIDEVTSATNLVQAQSALSSAVAIAQQLPNNSLVGGK